MAHRATLVADNVFTPDEVATIAEYMKVPERVVRGVGWLAFHKANHRPEIDETWCSEALTEDGATGVE